MPRAGTKGYRKYDISKDRYLELSHKAKQYPTWKQLVDGLQDTARAITYSDMPKAPQVTGSPTEDAAIKIAELTTKIDKVERSITLACDAYPTAYKYLLANITLGSTPDELESQWGLMPCGRNKFYDMRSKAFFLMHLEFQ